MQTPKPQTANDELADFMATLDADFSKKPKDTAQTRNKKFHADNPQISHAGGIAPELDMSGNWQPQAKVTYIIRQLCNTCNETVEFIGGEFILFQSKKQHARILRRIEHCPNHFHFGDDDEPLDDLVDEFNQTVSRCVGCIQVEHKATEIWETAIKNGEKAKKDNPELDIVIDLGDSK